MADKPFDKLDPIEQAVRRALPGGMRSGTLLTLRYISGFELFNTRPYHNYDDWGQGWDVQGEGIHVRREDLDDAVNEWCAQYASQKAVRVVEAEG